MTDQPPSLLGGRYEIGDLLGRGGMADVRRAHDRVLHRDVAVKLLRQGGHVDRERFVAEARTLALLGHRHVVTLLDAGVDDDAPWLVLELVEGETLADLLGRAPVPPADLAAIGADAASGLQHAHERGVVHRDVKPSNVLLGDRTRLADFGIARLVDVTSSLTLTGHTMGTVAYLSPEQVRGEPVTPATDVYALGLVLLEALTGQRAFDGPAAQAAVMRVHHGPLVPASLPPGWPGLLTSMTAMQPEDRPTAGAVAERLRVLAASGGRAVPDDLATATTVLATQPRDARRRPLLLVAAAVAVLLAVVAGGVLLGSSGEEPAADRTPSAPAEPSTSGPAGTPSAQPVDDPRTPSTPTAPAATSAAPAPVPPPAAGGPAEGKPKGKDKGKDKGKGKGKGKRP